MPYFRQIIEALPETITVPSALRNRRVEIIMLPLDEVASNGTPIGPYDLQIARLYWSTMSH